MRKGQGLSPTVLIGAALAILVGVSMVPAVLSTVNSSSTEVVDYFEEVTSSSEWNEFESLVGFEVDGDKISMNDTATEASYRSQIFGPNSGGESIDYEQATVDVLLRTFFQYSETVSTTAEWASGTLSGTEAVNDSLRLDSVSTSGSYDSQTFTATDSADTILFDDTVLEIDLGPFLENTLSLTQEDVSNPSEGSPYTEFAWEPEGEHFAVHTDSADRIAFYNTSTFNQTDLITPPSTSSSSFGSFESDWHGELYAVAHGPDVTVYNTSNIENVVVHQQDFPSFISNNGNWDMGAVAFSPDGNFLAVSPGSDSSDVFIFNTSDWSGYFNLTSGNEGTLAGQNRGTKSIEYKPDNRTVIAIGTIGGGVSDGGGVIYNVEEGRSPEAIVLEGEPVERVEWNSEGDGVTMFRRDSGAASRVYESSGTTNYNRIGFLNESSSGFGKKGDYSLSDRYIVEFTEFQFDTSTHNMFVYNATTTEMLENVSVGAVTASVGETAEFSDHSDMWIGTVIDSQVEVYDTGLGRINPEANFTVETSDDNFSTVKDSKTVELQNGTNTVNLSGFEAGYWRASLDLKGESGEDGPVADSYTTSGTVDNGTVGNVTFRIRAGDSSGFVNADDQLEQDVENGTTTIDLSSLQDTSHYQVDFEASRDNLQSDREVLSYSVSGKEEGVPVNGGVILQIVGVLTVIAIVGFTARKMNLMEM